MLVEVTPGLLVDYVPQQLSAGDEHVEGRKRERAGVHVARVYSQLRRRRDSE